MKKTIALFLSISIVLVLLMSNLLVSCSPKAKDEKSCSFVSGKYQNLFTDLLGTDSSLVNEKINKAWEQLFYGDSLSERLFYVVDKDMAYIQDFIHNDVRTEGISYGMMIAVQLDKKDEFDKLWKWAKTYLQHKTKNREGYFAWQAKTNGEKLDSNSASDGEIWYVTALFFASGRWGDGEGIFNYSAEANNILKNMLNKIEKSDDPKDITNMFNKQEKQVVFVPAGEADDFTDPSYHTPHYFELWAKWAEQDNQFWTDAATTSREFLKKTVHPKTGLAPDYAHFDGRGINPWNGGTDDFQYDAWRVAMNVAVDYQWFKADEWAVEQSNRLLKFFHSQGMENYVSLYTLDGQKKNDSKNPGLVAMNAVAALAATDDIRKEFVKELWEMEIPKGEGRYYDGLLYMLAMLQVSGNFKIYEPKIF